MLLRGSTWFAAFSISGPEGRSHSVALRLWQASHYGRQLNQWGNDLEGGVWQSIGEQFRGVITGWVCRIIYFSIYIVGNKRSFAHLTRWNFLICSRLRAGRESPACLMDFPLPFQALLFTRKSYFPIIDSSGVFICGTKYCQVWRPMMDGGKF